MSNMREHCVAMVAVVMSACVSWLQDAPLQWPTPVGMPMTWSPAINDTGMFAIGPLQKQRACQDVSAGVVAHELLASFHGRNHFS